MRRGTAGRLARHPWRRYRGRVDLDALYDAARAAWHAGDREGGLRQLETVVAHPDADVPHHSSHGLWLEQLGRLEEALVAFRRSIAVRPTASDHYNAGNMLLGLGRPDEALAEYEACLALEDGRPEAWVNRGIALQRLGRLDDAGPSFERALAVRADFLPALRCQAILARQRGEAEALEQAWARIAALRPDDAEAALELARALSALPADHHLELHPEGRDWRALEACRRAMALRPDDPRPAAWRVMVLARLKHANLAFRVMRPGGRGMEVELVAGPLETGRFLDEQLAVCQAAIARFPDDAWFHGRLADGLAFAGRHEAAVEALERAVALAPDDAGHVFELALSLGALGRIDEARRAARRAVELDAELEAELLEALELEAL